MTAPYDGGPNHTHGNFTFRDDRCLLDDGDDFVLNVRFMNDGTAEDAPVIGNYDVEVTINGRVLWKGRVENHLRTSGWAGLLHLLATQEGYTACADSD